MLSIIKSKLIQLFQKLFILPLVVVFTYFCLFLDTAKYPGFIGKHFLIDAKVYFALAILLVFVSSAKSGFLKLILKINTLILALISAIYVIFSFIEASHYPNYVFSTYHVHMGGLFYVLLFGISLFIINTQAIKLNTFKNIGHLLLIFVVLYTLIVNLGISTQKALEADFYVFFHLNDSYDQKMYFRWENFYTYMVFVENNTPKDATIVIPPQISPWWVRSGNFALVRYFLYPRELIQYSTERIPDVDSLPKGTYIMVAWGEYLCDTLGCHGWPSQQIKVSEAIYKEDNKSAIKMVKENFLYDPKDTSNPFGLLKL